MNSVPCMRCGVCCKKGGPSLHVDDTHLLTKQAIKITDLVCLRPGEIVSDPRAGKFVHLESDRIKIKGTDPTWACHYYIEENCSCGIYRSRPLECQALCCSDTTEIFATMSLPYLQRSHFVDTASGLWQCIQEHERSYPVAWAVSRAEQLSKDAAIPQELSDYIRAEQHFRSVLCERLHIQDEALVPYFGRSLAHILAPFGSSFARLRKLQK